MTPTFAAFTAEISNTLNTAGSGTLIMQEKKGADITCLSTTGGSISTNSATCASINKYGGEMAMVPTQTVTTEITIANIGTAKANAFKLTPGACVQANNGTVNGTALDLCEKYTITITSGTGTPKTIYTGTAKALGDLSTTGIDILGKLGITTVTAGQSFPITITAMLNSTAGNAYQGLSISQSLTWTFGA